MDKVNTIVAPFFDARALRQELTSLYRANSGNDTRIRSEVLERLKQLVNEARDEAERQLVANGDGRKCASGLALFQDELIRLIYDFTITHVYRAQNPSAAEHMAIAATGGYGRGLLAPGSDIDLLFILPYKQTAWGESVLEYMLYLLWDIGFKVGHATRTVEQCVKLGKSDMTIRTALLDARLILGEAALFDEFWRRFQKDVVKNSGRAFVEAKLAERDTRHERSGTSRYVVEPNIKDGKGGLRDLHTLHWLMKYLHDAEPDEEAVAEGIFTAHEFHAYRKCEDFLWTIRCHLHFLTRRAEERLSFELQPAMAERLGYSQHGGLRTVERFMKHYFIVAKEVGDLTRIVCAVLEMKQLKSLPSFNTLLAPLTWRRRARLRRSTDFRIDNGRINVANDDIFKRDPANLVRLFGLAETHGVPFHPDAIRLVRQSLRLIDDKLRSDPAANKTFLDLLTSKTSAERVLRKMNETGVLGRFVPDFGKVVSMMQFNMYHHYTVDEHSIRSVGILSDIERGELGSDHPLSTEILPDVQNRRALYVATFLHDVGKGRGKNHSIVGGKIARALCPRLGLNSAGTETVAWLIENHLVMSSFAQSRDLNDPKTIRDFADIVQSPERLRLLLILTVADIRAVGPGVWNGWKGQLLRTLYYETEPVLAGGHSTVSRKDRVESAQAKFMAALEDWPSETVEAFIERQYPAYWLRTETDVQVQHAKLVQKADDKDKAVATAHASDAFTAVTALTVYTASHPNLLAMMAGACSAAGANIVSAHIYTTRDGMALDTFLLQREFDDVRDERRRVKRIAKSIEKLLRGEIYLDQLFADKREPRGRLKAFTVEPQVVIDNSISNQFTVIEVNGLDRPGLLFDLTSSLSELNLDINSAHITTYGEKVVDVFYVTDLVGKKITASQRQATIRGRLIDVLSVAGVPVEEEAGQAAE
ncbi:MAG: [protein-PII] uridylyltransferase [Hyphomicrobiaceae bacterium]